MQCHLYYWKCLFLDSFSMTTGIVLFDVAVQYQIFLTMNIEQ